MNDLGAFLALGFRLAGHDALERFRQDHIFDFDDVGFDTPRLSLTVNDLAQALVDLIAMCQQFIQVGLAQHTPQGCLRDLAGGFGIIPYFDDRIGGIHWLKKYHRVNLHGDVIAGDDLLRLDNQCFNTHVHFDHAVNERDDEVQARTALTNQFAEAKHHALLILPDDSDRGNQQY